MSAVDDIVVAPDDRLKVVCEEITSIDASVRKLAKRMLKDMYATDGCGLAAPQLGEAVQLVVIDVDYGDHHRKNPYVLVNPRIVVADGTPRAFAEGCLSFPGVTTRVMRPSHVVVEARNLEGDLMRYEAEGNLLAVCLQHEIDHLQGITMVDHLPPAQRIRALRELEEAKAAGAAPGDTASDMERR